MKVTEEKRLDYLVQLHSAVITGLVASDENGNGLRTLELNMAENKVTPLLEQLLNVLVNTVELDVKLVPEGVTVLNDGERL